MVHCDSPVAKQTQMYWDWQNDKQMEVPSMSSFAMWFGDIRLGETGAKDRTHSLKHSKVTSMSYERTVRKPLFSGTEFFCCTCYISSPSTLSLHSPEHSQSLTCNTVAVDFKLWLSALYFFYSWFSILVTLYHGKHHHGISKACEREACWVVGGLRSSLQVKQEAWVRSLETSHTVCLHPWSRPYPAGTAWPDEKEN